MGFSALPEPWHDHNVQLLTFEGTMAAGIAGRRLAVVALLFGIASFFWFAQVYWVAMPVARGMHAPPTEFAAERAEQVLARILGQQRPHPVSTSENEAVRVRILNELASLGVPTSVHRGFACNSVRTFGVITCASVSDVVGEVSPGEGKAIILMAHYDSVPAGPGASDDESGVATVLETIRALKARGLRSQHPILALLTDGEEAGLLGAASFLHDPALRARVGAVINVEARGTRGRSLLFQTSPGDGGLIDLYASHVANYATSSLYAEIYRLLPNDTDLTLFIRAGFPAFNFAFSENVADYHTALDRQENLDPRTLQQHGDNLLGVTVGLAHADLDRLKAGNEMYVDLLGRALPRLPMAWALPLSLVAFVLLVLAVLVGREPAIGLAQWFAAFAALPALLVLAGLLGWLLHSIACVVSGMPDPSYAYPTLLRMALAAGVGGSALVVSRFAPARALSAAMWLWIAILAIASAILVPGLTPYFLLPALFAGVILLAAGVFGGGRHQAVGQIAILVCALPMLLLWIGFGAMGETVMGLRLHPLFTVPVAMGLAPLVPLLAANALPRRIWLTATGGMFVIGLGIAVLAGMQPSYSPKAPQRLSVDYIEDSNTSDWAVDALAPVPPSMADVVKFSDKREMVLPFSWAGSYVAPAPNLHEQLPRVRVLSSQPAEGGRRVTLALEGSESANQMALILPRPAGLDSVDIRDWHYKASPSWAKLDRVIIACMSRDCASTTLTLTFRNNAAFDAILAESRFGLPPQAARLVAARPSWAVPSQNGDGILLVSRAHFPQQ